MTEFYLLHIFALTLGQVSSLHFMKRYQLAAGTSLRSNIIYMVINGIISAIIPLMVLIFGGNKLEYTPYSLLIAFLIVILAALDCILRFKAYEAGQIATVAIISTLGSIILSCLWGVLILNEKVSIRQIIGILIMLISVLTVSQTHEGKLRRRLIWIYAVISVAGAFVSILSKQHQVETTFETVDTLSFSVWIGLIRTIVFLIIAIFPITKQGAKIFKVSRKEAVNATFSSVFSGTSYILTLFTSTVLPIVITSPLGVGFGILMGAFIPWVFYRERLTTRQLIGVALSLVGTMLFLW